MCIRDRYNDYSRIYTKTYQNAKVVKKGDTFAVSYTHLDVYKRQQYGLIKQQKPMM